MTTKHTPTPWTLSQYTNYEGFSIVSQDGECLAERWYDKARTVPQNEVLKANAAFMVRAVNGHEALVEALTKIQIISAHMKSKRSYELNRVATDALAKIKGAA